MWKRVPVLSNSRACGPRQQVRDGVDGRVVGDPEDETELRNTIHEMLATRCIGRQPFPAADPFRYHRYHHPYRVYATALVKDWVTVGRHPVSWSSVSMYAWACRRSPRPAPHTETNAEGAALSRAAYRRTQSRLYFWWCPSTEAATRKPGSRRAGEPRGARHPYESRRRGPRPSGCRPFDEQHAPSDHRCCRRRQ
jgi:hypothetical protein